MNEKEAIEKATADAFIELYNNAQKTSFFIVEYSDAPDIRCKDNEGNTLNFEITLTEDRPKDIQAALGRSDHRSLEALKMHLAEVKADKASPLERVSCLQGNVTDMIIKRIHPKFKKDYGENVALVVRDTSPVEWDWDIVIEDLKSQLSSERNPFDKGVWIITFRMDKIYNVL